MSDGACGCGCKGRRMVVVGVQADPGALGMFGGLAPVKACAARYPRRSSSAPSSPSSSAPSSSKALAPAPAAGTWDPPPPPRRSSSAPMRPPPPPPPRAGYGMYVPPAGNPDGSTPEPPPPTALGQLGIDGETFRRLPAPAQVEILQRAIAAPAERQRAIADVVLGAIDRVIGLINSIGGRDLERFREETRRQAENYRFILQRDQQFYDAWLRSQGQIPAPSGTNVNVPGVAPNPWVQTPWIQQAPQTPAQTWMPLLFGGLAVGGVVLATMMRR